MGITLEEAREILENMMKFASNMDPARASSFAVVDSAGVPICIMRMDGASPLTVRVSGNKAYTCIDTRRDTKESRELLFTGPNKRDVAWFGEPRYCPIPGGVLLKGQDGKIVGAVGTSGRIADEDEEIARIGAKAYENILTRREKSNDE